MPILVDCIQNRSGWGGRGALPSKYSGMAAKDPAEDAPSPAFCHLIGYNFDVTDDLSGTGRCRRWLRLSLSPAGIADPLPLPDDVVAPVPRSGGAIVSTELETLGLAARDRRSREPTRTRSHDRHRGTADPAPPSSNAMARGNGAWVDAGDGFPARRAGWRMRASQRQSNERRAQRSATGRDHLGRRLALAVAVLSGMMAHLTSSGSPRNNVLA